MILGMNITDESDKNREFLSREIGFGQRDRKLWRDYRPLGACSALHMGQISGNYASGDLA
jgi:hypothetical protein